MENFSRTPLLWSSAYRSPWASWVTRKTCLMPAGFHFWLLRIVRVLAVLFASSIATICACGLVGERLCIADCRSPVLQL